MNPEIWGPGAWLFLHSITLAYPNNPTELDKQNYKTFFEILKNVIPCKKCSYNYSKNIKDNNISNHLDSKVSLVKWLVNIHNQVNIENNKNIMEYKDVIKEYKKIINNNQKEIALFRSHPSYRSDSKQKTSIWYDWAEVRYENEIIPAQLLCFFTFVNNAEDECIILNDIQLANNDDYVIV